MIRKYKIEYYPYIDLKEYISDVLIHIGILEVILLVIMLINKMFVYDLLTPLLILLMPICMFLIYLLHVFIFTKVKISIDYINDKFIKRGIFKTKIYELKDIEIKREFDNESNPIHETTCQVVIYYKQKKIYKFNAVAFENQTNFQVSSILQE